MRLTTLLGVFTGLVGLSTSAPGSLSSTSVRSGSKTLKARDTCPVPIDIPVKAPRPNPFSALTIEESGSVVTWLMEDSALGLNLSDHTNTTLLRMSDNYIAHIETLKPNNTDVLSYLDGNGTVPRYARVVLNHGAWGEPVVAEYSVSSSSRLYCFSLTHISSGWPSAYWLPHEARNP